MPEIIRQSRSNLHHAPLTDAPAVPPLESGRLGRSIQRLFVEQR